MRPDQYKRVHQIFLTTTLDAVPVGPTCGLCGSPTDKAFIEHQLGLSDEILFQADSAAGYICKKDGTIYLSKEAVLEMLNKAREQLDTFDPSALVAQIDRSILFEQADSVNS